MVLAADILVSTIFSFSAQPADVYLVRWHGDLTVLVNLCPGGVLDLEDLDTDSMHATGGQPTRVLRSRLRACGVFCRRVFGSLASCHLSARDGFLVNGTGQYLGAKRLICRFSSIWCATDRRGCVPPTITLISSRRWWAGLHIALTSGILSQVAPARARLRRDTCR